MPSKIEEQKRQRAREGFARRIAEFSKDGESSDTENCENKTGGAKDA